ncbi:MAG: hypothetical protein ACTJLM_04030 [Ehrlichia sp.]
MTYVLYLIHLETSIRKDITHKRSFLRLIAGIQEDSSDMISQANGGLLLSQLYYIAMNLPNLLILKMNVNPLWIHETIYFMHCLNTFGRLHALCLNGYFEDLKICHLEFKHTVDSLASVSKVKYLFLNNNLLCAISFFTKLELIQISTNFDRNDHLAAINVIQLHRHFNQSLRSLNRILLPGAQIKAKRASITFSKGSQRHTIEYFFNTSETKNCEISNNDYSGIFSKPYTVDVSLIASSNEPQRKTLASHSNPTNPSIIQKPRDTLPLVIAEARHVKSNLDYHNVPGNPVNHTPSKARDDASQQCKISTPHSTPTNLTAQELINPLLLLVSAAEYLERNQTGYSKFVSPDNTDKVHSQETQASTSQLAIVDYAPVNLSTSSTTERGIPHNSNAVQVAHNALGHKTIERTYKSRKRKSSNEYKGQSSVRKKYRR